MFADDDLLLVTLDAMCSTCYPCAVLNGFDPKLLLNNMAFSEADSSSRPATKQ